MDTLSIRDLRGADLQEKAKAGEPLAITNYRVLIGVIIPVSPAWVEQLVTRNWPRIGQSISEGEQALAETTRPAHERAGETTAAADGHDFLSRLHAVFNPAETAGLAGASGAPEGRAPAGPAVVRPIRIGDLSAGRIEKAGAGGETLAITHDRDLIGILIPVTQDLVQSLVERNISSVLDSVRCGERELTDRG